jgi:hypothetical protein
MILVSSANKIDWKYLELMSTIYILQQYHASMYDVETGPLNRLPQSSGDDFSEQFVADSREALDVEVVQRNERSPTTEMNRKIHSMCGLDSMAMLKVAIYLKENESSVLEADTFIKFLKELAPNNDEVQGLVLNRTINEKLDKHLSINSCMESGIRMESVTVKLPNIPCFAVNKVKSVKVYVNDPSNFIMDKLPNGIFYEDLRLPCAAAGSDGNVQYACFFYI